jgi:hypothetical protein
MKMVVAYGPHRWSPRIVAALLALAGCAAPLTERAGAHAIHLTEIRFVPARVPAGCPTTLTLRFDDPQGDVVFAKAHWKHEQSNSIVRSRRVTLPFKPEELVGKTSGETSVEIRPDQPGTYSYYVQLEDAEGNRSNVLHEAIEVDGWRRC